MNKDYQLDFPKLCLKSGLGTLLRAPVQLVGGHLHRMYALETTSGQYAVKALNPQVMQRPEAWQNMINAERIARLASNAVPAVPAKGSGGVVIPEVDGQYYLIFDWIEGASLPADRLTGAHCEKMGQILAELHAVDFTCLGLTDDYYAAESYYDWNGYLRAGVGASAPWADEFRHYSEHLYRWNARLITAAKKLSGNTVISHGDLEPKNVLWRGDAPVVIDWEAAGYIHPMHDLIETALYWSAEDTGKHDKDKFTAFVAGYTRKAGMLHADWPTVLDKGFGGKLGWLDYSLKRSLGIECADEAERQMGTEHVTGTLEMLREYDNMQETIIEWLEAAGTSNTAGK